MPKMVNGQLTSVVFGTNLKKVLRNMHLTNAEARNTKVYIRDANA
jgi:hypothetical protein